MATKMAPEDDLRSVPIKLICSLYPGGCGLPIRKQSDYLTPFQIADNAGVPVIARQAQSSMPMTLRISRRTARAPNYEGASLCSSATSAAWR